MADQHDFTPQTRPFTGRHMLILIVSFFAVVIGVNATMAVIATKTWTGLVVKNGYVASQSFNDNLADARKQKALGWQSRLEYHSGMLRFLLNDREHQPVVGRRVVATLRRPVHEHEDQPLVFTADARGYVARKALEPGLWEIDVLVKGQDLRLYRQIFRITVPSGSGS